MEENIEQDESLGRKSAKGIAALASRQLILGAISTIAALIIFTILTPREVGIYTAVIAIQRIISFFTDFGFGAALIQKKESIEKEDIVTTFTFQISVTFTIFVLALIFRDQLAGFFRLSNDGIFLLLVLISTIFISSFKSIPSILLERKIQFHKLVMPQIFESLIFNLILITLVISGYGISSFSWAFLISSIASIPFYYYISPWPIGFGFSKSSLGHLKFGFQFQLKNILATVKDDFLTVILTRILTFTEIGYIGFAQRLAFLVYRYIVDSVTKVSFSTYSRLQSDNILLKKAIEKTMFFVSVVMFPILVGLAIAGPELISTIPQWENKWGPASLSLVFFSLNAVISSISGILVNVLDSKGRVKTTLRLMVIWTTLTWVLTPTLIFYFGYNGVSIASFIVSLTIFYTIYLVKKLVDFNFWSSIRSPLIGTTVMALLSFILIKLFVKDFVSLFIVGIIAVISYVTIVYMLSGEQLKNDILKIIKK